MTYYQAAAVDYSTLPLRSLFLRIDQFNRVHGDEIRFRVKLAGGGLGGGK